MENNAEKTDTRRIRWRAVGVVMLHGIIPVAWIIGSILVVPRFKAMFNETGSELPPLTANLLRFSDIASNNWAVYIFVMVAILVADAAICILVLRRASRTILRMWSASILLIQGTLSAIALIAIYKPYKDMLTSIE